MNTNIELDRVNSSAQRTVAVVPVFALALFTSAALLFWVQPLIAKMLLPLLGGAPSVWNTCMVFFQASLLAGYAYALLISQRVPLKSQAILHPLLLLAAAMVLPFALSNRVLASSQMQQSPIHLAFNYVACNRRSSVYSSFSDGATASEMVFAH